MTPTPKYPDGEPATERVIVLQFLRNDRSEWWRRAEMLRKLRDIDPDAVQGPWRTWSASGCSTA